MYDEKTQLWFVNHCFVKLRKSASDGLSVMTRTLRLLVQNVSEHLFVFKVRRSEYINSVRGSGNCYCAVAEKQV